MDKTKTVVINIKFFQFKCDF